MKKTVSLVLIFLVSLSLAACGGQPAAQPKRPSTEEAALPEPADAVSQSPSPGESDGRGESPGGQADSATARHVFTISEYHDLEVGYWEDLAEGDPVTFSLEAPADWLFGGDPSHYFAYEEINGPDFPFLHIEGLLTADPAEPFRQVQEEFDNMVYLEEVDLLEYPVLRNIYSVEASYATVYRYEYYISLQGVLIYIDVGHTENTPETLELFDGIVATFSVE